MNTNFALDLKVARRKSGLTQEDCAHLLDVHPSRISRLESGGHTPTVEEVCALSLIYGKSFESPFSSVFGTIRKRLREQLATLPHRPRSWLGRFNRNNTLHSISARLDVSEQTDHGRL